MNLKVYKYNHTLDTIDMNKYISSNARAVNVDLSGFNDYNTDRLIHNLLINDPLPDTAEKLDTAINKFDSSLTDNIFLFFYGFDNFSEEGISDFVQGCYIRSNRCQNLVIILLIPNHKCKFQFQDGSKIKPRDIL